MNNSQRGFIIPLVVAIIAILAVGGGVYVYTQSKQNETIGSQNKEKEISKNNQITNSAITISTESKIEISKISGSTSLNSGESGTWQIEINNPTKSSVTYGVIWGDEPEYTNVLGGMPLSAIKYQVSPKFSHVFSLAANSKITTWTPTFFVKDSNGNVVRKGIQVNVQISASNLK